MSRWFAFVFTLVFAVAAGASGLPEQIVVTPSNAKALGFSFEDLSEKHPSDRAFRITFPLSVRDGCKPNRVQTALLDRSGKQSSITSFDYEVLAAPAAVVAGYSSLTHDMSIQVQYCCDKGKYPGCKYAYVVKSISAFYVSAP